MKVKDVVEVGLLYLGVPTVTLYQLNFLGLFIPLCRDNFFPHYDFNTIWNAVARGTNTEVVGTGIQLLYFTAPHLAGYRRRSLNLYILGEAARGREGTWTLEGMVASLPASSCCRLRRSCPTTAYTSMLGATFCSWPVSGDLHRGRGLDRPCKDPGHDQ